MFPLYMPMAWDALHSQDAIVTSDLNPHLYNHILRLLLGGASQGMAQNYGTKKMTTNLTHNAIFPSIKFGVHHFELESHEPRRKQCKWLHNHENLVG